jgi:hypothetical protein
MQTEQQRIERYYFGLFRRAYRLPEGRVKHGDKPDVIIHGERKIGIELTNFYLEDGALPSSEQRQREQRDSVVSKSQELYSRRTKKNIQMTVSFDKSHPIQDDKDLINRIAEFAERIDSEENGQIYRDKFADIPELDFVYLQARQLQYTSEPVQGFPDGEPDAALEGFDVFSKYMDQRHYQSLCEGNYKPLPADIKWQLSQLNSPGLMSPERLKEIIKEKEVKARDYEVCDAYWLLVIVDFINSAQEQEIRIGDVKIDSNVFQKIIVFRTGFNHILEVKGPH